MSASSTSNALTWRGNATGVAALIVLLSSVSLAAGVQTLIARPLWMDEVHSWILITDPDPSHALAALADGADFNPPGWYVVTRGLNAVCGGLPESGLRLLSACWMLLSAAGVFLLLRRRFDVASSLAAVMLAFAHPLMVHQATEIRFYACWCAAIVWLIHALTHKSQTRRGHVCCCVMTIVFSTLVTTCHYFGILSVALVAVPGCLRWGCDRRLRQRTICLSIAGILSLVCCLPMLASQRAALTRPTWISPPTVQDSIDFAMVFLPAWKIVVCGGFLAAALFMTARRSDRQHGLQLPKFDVMSHRMDSGLVACSLLSLMPVVIIAVSWTLQPALVTRYAIVGLPGLAPIFATLIVRGSEVTRQMAVIVGITSVAWIVSSTVQTERADAVRENQLVAALHKLPVDEPILFEDRIEFCRVLHEHPELQDRICLLDFEDNELLLDSALRIVQRDAGRAMRAWYPQFAMSDLAAMREVTSFVLVLCDGSESAAIRIPCEWTHRGLGCGLLRITPAIPHRVGDRISVIERSGVAADALSVQSLPEIPASVISANTN